MKMINLIIVGILIIMVLLSGCFSSSEKTLPDGTKVKGDIDKVEIVNYSIKAFGIGTWGSPAPQIGEGFIHNNVNYYRISGIVKNIEKEMINVIAITVNFYDKNGIFLSKEVIAGLTLALIPSGYTGTFESSFIYENVGYVNLYDHISFEVNVYNSGAEIKFY